MMRRYEWIRVPEDPFQELDQDNVPFSRKKPYGQNKFIAEMVHAEYAKHAEAFEQSFPNLKTLKIDDGYFSFKTAALFPSV